MLERMKPPSKVPMSIRTEIDLMYQRESPLQIAIRDYVRYLLQMRVLPVRFKNAHEKPPCNWEFEQPPDRQWVKGSNELAQKELEPLNEIFETVAPKILTEGILYGESFVFLDPGSRWLFSRVKTVCPSTLQRDSSYEWSYEHLPPEVEKHEWQIVRFDFGAPLAARLSSDLTSLCRLETQHRMELERGFTVLIATPGTSSTSKAHTTPSGSPQGRSGRS